MVDWQVTNHSVRFFPLPTNASHYDILVIKNGLDDGKGFHDIGDWDMTIESAGKLKVLMIDLAINNTGFLMIEIIVKMINDTWVAVIGTA